MSGRGTLARRLVFAGAAISLATWAVGERRHVDDAVEEKPLIPDDVALAAARGLDPPRSRRPFRSRLATSLVFATIFCAGAALTAGAGNEVSRMDATPLAEATTTAAEAEAPVPPAEESTPAPTPEPAPAPEPTPVTEPAPAPEPIAAEAPAAEPQAAGAKPHAPTPGLI
jgi:outer membrane biosynthesis protein TonB